VAILTAILNTLIVVICLFLICLILIQRGKGGGLAGAFGGMGGSSAFGTKAGDVFTRVTMIVAGIWIVLSMFLVILYNQGGQSAWGTDTTLSKEVAPKSGKTTGSGSKASPSTPVPPPPAPEGPVSAPAIPDASQSK
jgi:preprotein translocase subunit SecG